MRIRLLVLVGVFAAVLGACGGRDVRAQTRSLTLTPAVSSSLVAAEASLQGLSVADYQGLRPDAHYAFDGPTQTYWAAGSMDPAKGDLRGEVSTQDDGAYTLFRRTRGGAWHATNVGMADVPGSYKCPLVPPRAVAVLWGWPAGSCSPAFRR